MCTARGRTLMWISSQALAHIRLAHALGLSAGFGRHFFRTVLAASRVDCCTEATNFLRV